MLSINFGFDLVPPSKDELAKARLFLSACSIFLCIGYIGAVLSILIGLFGFHSQLMIALCLVFSCIAVISHFTQRFAILNGYSEALPCNAAQLDVIAIVYNGDINRYLRKLEGVDREPVLGEFHLFEHHLAHL